MLPLPAGREASAGVAASLYERHRPGRTLLYQLVEEHCPAFTTVSGATPGSLVRLIQRTPQMQDPRLRHRRGGLGGCQPDASKCWKIG